MEQQQPKEILKLSDDVLIMIREIIQLSLLTGENIVENLRELRLVRQSSDSPYLLVDEHFVKVHNQYVEDLQKRVDELQAKEASVEA